MTIVISSTDSNLASGSAKHRPILLSKETSGSGDGLTRGFTWVVRPTLIFLECLEPRVFALSLGSTFVSGSDDVVTSSDNVGSEEPSCLAPSAAAIERSMDSASI